VRATGWSNGHPTSSGGGYGLRIMRGDRDRFFSRNWSSVTLEFPNGDTAVVSLSASFWGRCTELRSSSIGRWFINERAAPWPPRRPPAVELTPLGDGRFRVGEAGPA
jgi:hypothetical protein